MIFNRLRRGKQPVGIAKNCDINRQIKTKQPVEIIQKIKFNRQTRVGVSCESNRIVVPDHFADASKMVVIDGKEKYTGVNKRKEEKCRD